MEDTVPNKCILIINYLPQSLTDEEFYELFESVGKTTSTRIIRDKATNYSFGYGFVTYESEEDAAKAIEQLNGQHLQHKTIKVAYSQPSGPQTKNINLHVSGLPAYMTDETLKQCFTPYGNVTQCRVVKDKNSSQCQGFGFVLYSCRDEALTAIKGLNGTLLDGTEDCILAVKFAKTEQKGPPASYLRKIGRFSKNGSYGNTASYKGNGGGPMRGHSFRGRYSPMAAGGGSNSYNSNRSVYSSYSSNFNQDNFYGSGGGGDYQYNTGEETIVFVYGIGPHTDEDRLWNMFSPFGTILRVNVIYDQAKGLGKGYGFVTFSAYSEATYAIHNMNGTTYQGRELQVSIKTDAP